jgi:hypothetical protein
VSKKNRRLRINTAARRCWRRLSFFSRQFRLAFPTAWISLPLAQETESHATPAELRQHADEQRAERLAGS